MIMSTLIPFQFESHALRVQVDEVGQPWFNASDACAALELGNPRQALDSHVDSEDVQKLDTLTPGGRQRQNHVNESGLYALILGSTKDAAKRFKRWVTSEVLPSIRKTGAYSAPPVAALPAPTQDRVSSLLLIGDAVAKVPGVKAGIAMAATLTCIQENTGLAIETLRQ
jgi:prophage antirepressor-like protein